MPEAKIPYFNIRPNRITVYERYAEKRKIFSEKFHENKKNLKDHGINPHLSDKAKKRLRDAIDWLLYLSEEKHVYNKKFNKSFRFKISFITLTLASKQVHSDTEIKEKLLNSFLTLAKSKWHIKNYVWRAEPQKNGNIHFHIITDKFIPHQELRNAWNKIQEHLGYVSVYARKHSGLTKNTYINTYKHRENVDIKKLSKSYENGCSSGWQNPNSTDVHSVRLINNLSAYLSKYCTKKSEVRDIQGAQWRLSYSLSQFNYAFSEMITQYRDELCTLYGKFRNRVRFYDHASVLYVPVHEWIEYAPLCLYAFLNQYVETQSSMHG